jgi:hypothetical protein
MTGWDCVISLSKLNCTFDPAQLKQKGGGGAECSYEAAN